jgi:hypothetical protein
LGRRIGFKRALAIVTATVFCLSSVFSAVAGFVHDRESWPPWRGVLDVAIAFCHGVLALVVLAAAQGKVTEPAREATYRAYRVLIHGIFAAHVAFVLAGDRIVWGNCLTGFAWRAWLLMYCLPEWFTLFRIGQEGRAEQTVAADPARRLGFWYNRSSVRRPSPLSFSQVPARASTR